MKETMDNSAENARPPQWPLKIMRFFVKKEYLEEIEGDMEEIFHDNAELFSVARARRIYTLEMLKLFRPILIRNLQAVENLNQFAMFKNYFKISFRGLMKNPLNSFINIFGLAAAIGICVFAYAFAQYTIRTNQFHVNKNEVFLATFFAKRDGSVQQFGRAPRPLAEMLQQDFPQIKNVCRVEDRSVVVKYRDNVFHERVRFTDAPFLEMFTFPLKWGTRGSLHDVNSIILSEEMSIKYFGEENPVGENIMVKFSDQNAKLFKVTGVAEKFPASRTLEFTFLINIENLKAVEPTYDFHDWKEFLNATLIQVADASAMASVNSGMEKYRRLQNQAAGEDWAISSFYFEPLATLHKTSDHIRDDISRSSADNYETIVFLVVIAVLMLALACLNYINIAIVSAARRLKEIGVRKSIGASRKAVIVQFLSENIVITFFAIIIGVILGYTFFIPGFEYMWNFSMDFRLIDTGLWLYLPFILVVTAVASGIYPSLYISRFNVVGILKGSVKFGQRNPVTKVFLGIQLVLACIFITSAVMFTQNTNFLSKRSWGYHPAEVLYASVPDQAAFERLSALVSQDRDVQAISGSAHHLGKSHRATVLHFPDRQIEVDQLSVDSRYAETMGLEIKQGRFFNDHENSDRRSVVINELFVRTLEWDQPIGRRFKIDSIEYEVIGVAKDYHTYSFNRQLRPTILNVADKSEFRYLSMKVRPGSEVKAFQMLQAKWNALYPEVPFEGGHQEDVWGRFFDTIAIHSIVWKVMATIAIMLAGLGLYGLMTLNVAGRTKEFSIRKVLGAGWQNIAANISNQYLLMLVISLSIGAPLSYFLISMIIQDAYQYHMPLDFSGTAIAVVIIVTVLVITLSTQIRKVLKANSVDGLKME